MLLVGVRLLGACHAQVSLKPRDATTQGLRPKNVEAVIDIKGSFAQTRVVTTFQNELNQQTEADFSYTVPDGAVVTGFAYWFKGEKVVARVVEKERAAAIYSTITRPRGDPALIEQIDANTFRARIFPVEANADLKVEMQWIQVLPSDAKGSIYTFPLKSEIEGKGTLDLLDVKVRVQPDALTPRIINNYKLPLQDEGKVQTLRLLQKKYRAPQDLTVRFERPLRALHTSLYAAPSGGREGFFAIVVTPNQNLAAPKLQISGVSTFGVLPARLPALRAHQPFLIVGRYRRSGKATISLSGYGANVARQSVMFGSTRENNNPATKFWASRQIEYLSANNKSLARNRERIIELSTRFTLPSRVTSWLAVPKSEWENFKRQIAWEEIERYGPMIARNIKEGRAKTRETQRLRKLFVAACRIVGENPRTSLANFIASYRSPEYYKWQNQRYVAASKMQQALIKGNMASAAKQRRQVVYLSRRMGESQTEIIRRHYYDALHTLAGEWARQKIRPNADMSKLRVLETRMTRLAPTARANAITIRNQAAQSALRDEVWSIGAKIADEIAAGRQESRKVKELRWQAEQSGKRFGISSQKILEEATRSSVRSRASQIVTRIVNREWKFEPDLTNSSADEQQLVTLIPDAGERAALHREVESRWASRTWQFANEIVEERAQEKPNQQKLTFLQATLKKAVRISIQNHGSDKEVSEKALESRAEEILTQQEVSRYQWEVSQILVRLDVERAIPNSDRQRVAEIEKDLDVILQRVSKPSQKKLQAARQAEGFQLSVVRDRLIAEHHRESPDPQRIAHLENELIRLAPHDRYDRRWGRARITDTELYGKLRGERIKVRVEGEKLDRKLSTANTLAASEKTTLVAERAMLAKRERELAVRMGDPLIAVEAPEDAQQVIAIFPDGSVKKLQWNADARRWEMRFDVPTYAQEGQYSVQVVILLADGSRRNLTFRFRVDVTAPKGIGAARRVLGSSEGERVLRLELAGDEDTARVHALLPWDEKFDLAPSNESEHKFFALVPVPPTFAGEMRNVEFILTDRAHNRTRIVVDLSEEQR